MLITSSLKSTEAPEPTYLIRDNQIYKFLIEDVSLLRPDFTCTFAGTSLGFKAIIMYEQAQVMETTRKAISGNNVTWNENFQM